MSRTTAIALCIVLALVGAVSAVFWDRLFPSHVLAPGWSVAFVAEDLPNVDNIIVAADGTFYVTLESNEGRIVHVAANGEQTTVHDGLEKADGLLLHDGRLFATEERHDGRVIALVLVDLSVTELLRLDNPEGIAMMSDGTLVISEDTDPGRIVSLTPDGTFNVIADALKRPEGLDISTDGSVYVAETATGRILRVAGLEREVILDNLTHPDQIAFDANGALWITEDDSNGRLLRLHDGVLSVIASGLDYPQGIDFDSDGRVYVSEQGKGRILRFTHQP